MRTLEKLSLNRNAQNLITFLFYITFTIFSFIQIVHASNISSRVFYFLLLLLILGFALYSEYLKHLFRQAIQAIAFDLDTEKGNEIFNKLLQKDIFHAYKNDKKVLDTLYYLDQMEFDTCLDYIEQNSTFFHSSIDQLLIYHYTKFYCSYNLGHYNVTREEYTKLIRMKTQKIKGAKVSPLYNWEFIDAIYLSSKKEHRQSLNTFKTVNTKNMNNREKIHYYYQYAKEALHSKDSMEASKYISYIKQFKGKSKICQKGEFL